MSAVTITTSSHPCGVSAGDRFVLSGKSNRFRHRIGRVVNRFVFEVEEFVRPSRGFARHVRRAKQARRKP